MRIKAKHIVAAGLVLSLAQAPALSFAGNAAAPSLLSRWLPPMEQDTRFSLSQSVADSFNIQYHNLSGIDTLSGLSLSPMQQSPDFSYADYLGNEKSYSGLASFDFTSFYGASRIDLVKADESPSPFLKYEDSLSLDLEAGLRFRDVNAGLLYTYRRNFQPHESGLGSFYPQYFLNAGLLDYREDFRSTDAQAVFMYLGYNFSNQLNLRGTFGLGRTVSQNLDSSLNPSEQNRRWGIDVAASFRILDNLFYEAHLGYVNIDDSKSSGGGVSAAPPSPDESRTAGSSESATKASSGGAPSVYHIGSHIRMTF